MFLLCVDPPDAEACAAALSSVLKTKDDVAVVSFDLGLRNFSLVANQLSEERAAGLASLCGGRPGIMKRSRRTSRHPFGPSHPSRASGVRSRTDDRLLEMFAEETHLERALTGSKRPLGVTKLHTLRMLASLTLELH